jgi:hypothetical protein
VVAGFQVSINGRFWVSTEAPELTEQMELMIDPVEEAEDAAE